MSPSLAQPSPGVSRQGLTTKGELVLVLCRLPNENDGLVGLLSLIEQSACESTSAKGRKKRQ